MDARKLVQWSWVAVGVVALWTAVVFAMRWQANRDWEERTRQRQAETDRSIVERYGGGELKLLTFYANPPAIRAGGRTLLCYGVANAVSVGIEPSVDALSPSISRCVEVRPVRNTEYKLTATGRNGERVSASAKVDVR
jgi:hypothetical protein